MTTYGSLPGIRIQTVSGEFQEAVIGREVKAVFVGVGESGASAPTNEGVLVQNPGAVESEFGADSDIARAYARAQRTGLNTEFAHAVRAETQTANVTESTESGTLANVPIVPDQDRISVDDSGTSLDLTFDYASSLGSAGSNEFILNPITGEWAASYSGSDIAIEYEYANWSAAMDAVADVFVEGDFGLVVPLVNAEGPITDAVSVVSDMRQTRQVFALVLGAATPNATIHAQRPGLDPASFSLPSSYEDKDQLFIVGPTTLAGAEPTNPEFGVGALGTIAGQLGGSAVGDPLYSDLVDVGDGLAQNLNIIDVNDLRQKRIIPLKNVPEVGGQSTVRIEDNQSVYEGAEDEWERDLYRRQIVDLTLNSVRQTARANLGAVLSDDTIADVEDAVNSIVTSFVQRSLLEPGENSFRVYRAGANEVGIDLTIKPTGVVKAVDAELTVAL